MKRTVLLIITALLALCAFTACKTNDDTHTNDIESYDNISVFIPETSETGNESKTVLSGEIVVKDVKYSGEMGDFAVITIENGTDKDFEITVNCTFLDKDGNTLKTESQTFEQYSSGYTNNFIFYPEIEFETFAYTIETAEASGPFYAQHIDTAFKGLEQTLGYIFEECDKGNWKKYPTVCCYYSYGYSGEEPQVKTYARWLLINEQNKAVWVSDHIRYLESGLTPGTDWSCIELYQTTDMDYKMPESWQGAIKAIVAITNVTTEQRPPAPPMTE